MKILILHDMGSAYRLNGDTLEFAPLTRDGVITTINDATFNTDDFSPVEPELVGEEIVIFKGCITDLYHVFNYALRALRSDEQ